MKLTIVIIGVAFLFSCAPKIIALRGSYPPTPIINTTDKSFDRVWDNVIDFFSQNGIPIKIIEKSSGLIVSGGAALSWSFEDKTGKLITPKSYVVLQKVINRYEDKPFLPRTVTGEWNVHVKSVDGKTTINVNLYNIMAVYGSAYYSTVLHSTILPVTVEGKTTGVFEQTFYDAVK